MPHSWEQNKYDFAARGAERLASEPVPPAAADEAAAPAVLGALPAPTEKAAPKPAGDAEIVTLDSFRKR